MNISTGMVHSMKNEEDAFYLPVAAGEVAHVHLQEYNF
jgi:hypothetical protein